VECNCATVSIASSTREIDFGTTIHLHSRAATATSREFREDGRGAFINAGNRRRRLQPCPAPRQPPVASRACLGISALKSDQALWPRTRWLGNSPTRSIPCAVAVSRSDLVASLLACYAHCTLLVNYRLSNRLDLHLRKPMIVRRLHAASMRVVVDRQLFVRGNVSCRDEA